SHLEGNSGTTSYTFTVKIGRATCRERTENYGTADGSDQQPGDYASTSGTLTFLAGETTKTVTVNVNGDIVYEHDETFNVNLSAATEATISDASGLGTIQNDDAQPSFAIDDVSHLEGNSGTTSYTFTV